MCVVLQSQLPITKRAVHSVSKPPIYLCSKTVIWNWKKEKKINQVKEGGLQRIETVAGLSL